MRPPPAEKPRIVPDILEAERPHGGRARAVVFKRETAAELASFAVRANPHDYEVFHLHGRAVDGATERLVITEPDYQDVYMRDAPEAHVMNEALTATMAGNPLVFIGMGMLEGDFLRPLRQFVAGPGSRINRNVVALLPAEESLARQAKLSLHLHLRYGVHTIFYGTGGKRTGEEAPLYLAIKELGSLRKALKPKTRAGAEAKLSHSRAALDAFCREPPDPAAETSQKVAEKTQPPNVATRTSSFGLPWNLQGVCYATRTFSATKRSATKRYVTRCRHICPNLKDGFARACACLRAEGVRTGAHAVVGTVARTP